jgi:hypothetical protein
LTEGRGRRRMQLLDKTGHRKLKEEARWRCVEFTLEESMDCRKTDYGMNECMN